MFFESQGLRQPKMFSLGIPAVHEEVGRMLGDLPIHAWKADLRFHLVDDTSPYLSEAFAQEHFDFHRRQMRGQEAQKARWKRVLGAIADQAGEALGQRSVEVAFPPASTAHSEQLVRNPRAAPNTPIEDPARRRPEHREKDR